MPGPLQCSTLAQSESSFSGPEGPDGPMIQWASAFKQCSVGVKGKKSPSNVLRSLFVGFGLVFCSCWFGVAQGCGAPVILTIFGRLWKLPPTHSFRSEFFGPSFPCFFFFPACHPEVPPQPGASPPTGRCRAAPGRARRLWADRCGVGLGADASAGAGAAGRSAPICANGAQGGWRVLVLPMDQGYLGLPEARKKTGPFLILLLVEKGKRANGLLFQGPGRSCKIKGSFPHVPFFSIANGPCVPTLMVDFPVRVFGLRVRGRLRWGFTVILLAFCLRSPENNMEQTSASGCCPFNYIQESLNLI